MDSRTTLDPENFQKNNCQLSVFKTKEIKLFLKIFTCAFTV